MSNSYHRDVLFKVLRISDRQYSAIRHLSSFLRHRKLLRRGGRKNIRTRGCGGVQKMLSSGPDMSYCPNDLTTSMVPYIRSKSNSSNGEGEIPETSPLARELLTADGFWVRQGHFSLGNGHNRLSLLQ